MNHVMQYLRDADKQETTLSTEAIDYIDAQRELTNLDNGIMAEVNSITLSLEALVNIEASLVILDRSIESGEVSKLSYVSELTNISTEAVKLCGSNNELSNLVNELADIKYGNEYELSLEAYKKKRSGVLDNIINRVWDTLSAVTSMDSWKTAISDINALFSNEKKLLTKLASYVAELKSGARVMRKNPELSKGVKLKLGVYSGRYDKYTTKDHLAMIKDVFALFKDGVMDSSLETVHDSLVQSVSEEVSLPKHTNSLKYIEGFKNLDLDDVLYTDTKIIIPAKITGNTLHTLQVVQDGTVGVDFHVRGTKIDAATYSDLEVGKVDVKGLIDVANYCIAETPAIRNITNSKQLKAVLKVWVKNLRSALATIFYQTVFNIFALRRLVRNVYLANNYVREIGNVWIQLYSEWTSLVSLQISIIDDLTVLKDD